MRIAFSRQRLARRVAQLGRAISRDYAGQTLDIVAILENSFLFAADLVREISQPVVCHFVRTQLRHVELGGHPRQEVFFSTPPVLGNRDVLVVDAVLHTGVTQDFLLKRLEACQPRSLRLAVLFDKARDRKVDLRPEYVGFAAASKQWVGYGLAGPGGLYRNLPYVAIAGEAGAASGRRRAAKRRRGLKG